MAQQKPMYFFNQPPKNNNPIYWDESPVQKPKPKPICKTHPMAEQRTTPPAISRILIFRSHETLALHDALLTLSLA